MDPINLPKIALDPLGMYSGNIHQPRGEDPESIRKAAQEFEGFFISYLLKIMRETVHAGLLKNESGQMFYSFYDQEIGRQAAQAGGFGLGAMVEDYIRQQNAVTGGTALKLSAESADTADGTGGIQDGAHSPRVDAYEGRK